MSANTLESPPLLSPPNVSAPMHQGEVIGEEDGGEGVDDAAVQEVHGTVAAPEPLEVHQEIPTKLHGGGD